MSDVKWEVTEPCCKVWPQIADGFRWFSPEGSPDIRLMPCLDGTNWRVNYCPSCGRERRGTIERDGESK
jgi:hypothetical protein